MKILFDEGKMHFSALFGVKEEPEMIKAKIKALNDWLEANARSDVPWRVKALIVDNGVRQIELGDGSIFFAEDADLFMNQYFPKSYKAHCESKAADPRAWQL